MSESNLLTIVLPVKGDRDVARVESILFPSLFPVSRVPVLLISDEEIEIPSYLRDHVRQISDDEVGHEIESGWMRQQVLKLNAARFVDTRWMLTMDADCFFVAKGNIRDIAFVGGKARVDIGEQHDKWWKASALCLGKAEAQIRCCVTPMLLHTKTVNNLLDEGYDLNKFMSRGATEYTLYWTYLGTRWHRYYVNEKFADRTIWAKGRADISEDFFDGGRLGLVQSNLEKEGHRCSDLIAQTQRALRVKQIPEGIIVLASPRVGTHWMVGRLTSLGYRSFREPFNRDWEYNQRYCAKGGVEALLTDMGGGLSVAVVHSYQLQEQRDPEGFLTALVREAHKRNFVFVILERENAIAQFASDCLARENETHAKEEYQKEAYFPLEDFHHFWMRNRAWYRRYTEVLGIEGANSLHVHYEALQSGSGWTRLDCFMGLRLSECPDRTYTKQRTKTLGDSIGRFTTRQIDAPSSPERMLEIWNSARALPEPEEG